MTDEDMTDLHDFLGSIMAGFKSRGCDRGHKNSFSRHTKEPHPWLPNQGEALRSAISRKCLVRTLVRQLDYGDLLHGSPAVSVVTSVVDVDHDASPRHGAPDPQSSRSRSRAIGVDGPFTQPPASTDRLSARFAFGIRNAHRNDTTRLAYDFPSPASAVSDKAVTQVLLMFHGDSL
jgi:hypothetical protein